jgi:hypothetical protein
VNEGDLLKLAEILRSRPEEERAEIAAQIAEQAAPGGGRGPGDGKGRPSSADQAKALLANLEERDFGEEYQRWYSTALRVVEQLLPDRYGEFRELYRLDKPPKELTVTSYTVSDFVHGTRMTRNDGEEVFDAVSVATTKFGNQISILASARSRLDSLLSDIEGTLEATLLDDELETAAELLKAKHLRSAGIVAGVVLERHLKSVLADRGLSLGRKKSQIGNLNDVLKEGKVIDVPRWREIQRLGDIRNLCGHDGEREPSADEVQELIDGTAKVIASVF